nr:arginine--tRNA ligase, chloroplastic/mitochondrial [Tanacetum cinerariifolium]
NPSKNPFIWNRFEVFTIYLHVTRDHEFKGGKVCGILEVSDYYGLPLDGCEFLIGGGDDGHIRMHFVLLSDVVDATIKVKFGMGSNRRVCEETLAYYGEFDYGDDNLVKSIYKASLFEYYDGSNSEGGDVIIVGCTLQLLPHY